MRCLLSGLRYSRSLFVVMMIAASPLLRAADTETFRAETRGFGKVDVDFRTLGEKKNASLTTFSAQDPEHAKITASKRLSDLLGFGDLKIVADSGLPGSVLKLDNVGWWLLGTEGLKFHELFAPDKDALAKFAKEAKAVSWTAVPARAYPRWMDCFDNAGPGVWVGGGGEPYTIPADFEWLKERKLAFCTRFPDESRLVAPGLADNTIFDWHSTMARQYDLPYRTLLFNGSNAGLWNYSPLPWTAAESGFLRPWLSYQSNPESHIHDPIPALDPYLRDWRRQVSKHLGGDPNCVGWQGSIEVGTVSVLELAAVSQTPGYRERWHRYLKEELGLDLAGAGRLHKGDPGFYKSWNEVEIPQRADFVGWNPKTCLSLLGNWQMHEDTGRSGEKAAWFDPSKAPADWVEGDCADPMIQVYVPKRMSSKPDELPFFWMRRNFKVPAENIGGLKYLHIARGAYQYHVTPLFSVWLNGRKLKPLNKPPRYDEFSMCFAVEGILREGENSIVMNTSGSPVNGYCFLGATPLRDYPFMGEAENRLWFDAVNFGNQLRMERLEERLAAMRAAEPNRPFKLMAMKHSLDLSTALCKKYGAHQHDTGLAGTGFIAGTGARLARAHGLPWSSEQAGPPANVTEFQQQITCYLMYGNDILDMVFSVNSYRDRPALAAWFDTNLELIRCIGKMHLPVPPVGILFSTRASRLGFGEMWNWDAGRGALQGTGRNFAYLEIPDLQDSTVSQFSAVMDAGTVLMTEKDVEGILKYVEKGGTFVAQHHTGRHLPAKADAWPLAKAAGLSVTPKWITNEDQERQSWPLEKIRFTDKQKLMPSLRGKQIEGSGVSIDYVGTETGGAVALHGKGDSIIPVAHWQDGSMAVAEWHHGKGKIIFLGSPFFTRMKDDRGTWVNDESRSVLFDEFLTNLGLPRDSWTGNLRLWAEIWRSKNGVYDLYPVARMEKDSRKQVTGQVKIRRSSPVSSVTDIGSLGHPQVKVEMKDGGFVLPEMEWTPMQTRMFAAPRAEIAHSGLDWFKVQSDIWRALPAVPESLKAPEIPLPDDVMPLADGWNLKVKGQPDRVVSPGAFATLGLPEESIATFEKTVTVPPAWKGRKIELAFNSQKGSWGVNPQGKLFINGQESPLKIERTRDQSFSLDITEAATAGQMRIRLEVDGVNVKVVKRQPKSDEWKPTQGPDRPNGVTGIFYLRSTKPAIKTQPLGPWYAATAFNRLQAVKPGDKVKCTYLETRFKLPGEKPAKRLFLETSAPMGFLMLNGDARLIPPGMQKLDISGLLRRDGGENVLRWTPDTSYEAAYDKSYTGIVPEMNLIWTD
ncbi:MAG: hypothetical protein WC637_17530 [Victivallales bacterium]